MMFELVFSCTSGDSCFGDVPDQLEAERQVAAGGDGAGDGAVEPERHVDARRVAAVGARVVDVIRD